MALAAGVWLVATFGMGLERAAGQLMQPGELPLDALQFKGSHNSYERLQPNDRQIAEYNCWAVEFDLNWDGNNSGNYNRGVWVAHD